MLADPPDFVWNVAEGEGTSRNRESRVPAVCEMLAVPYSGSDPLTLAAALDKDVAKRLLAGAAVEVPRGLMVPADIVDDPDRFLDFLPWAHWEGCSTFIVKPSYEGSSKGIRSRCLADTPSEAFRICLDLARDYGQPILVEEYVAGDEVTVGLVGNGDRAEILGAMRIRPRVPDDRFVYSIEMKREWSDRIEYETPALLEPVVMERIRRAAMTSYWALGCRDLARIDFRIRAGIPYFIEANPLPGLAPDWSDMVLLARGMGISYADLVRRVLHEALSRVGMAATPIEGERT
jgi:D-alanine-D-alanine ligase